MRINNNMMAMNTSRQLNIVGGNQAKSMEKLSSGYRINRAGDDAAGLAISEKMRAQVRGLNQASRNAQDGISLIQTAEGALTETHAILQRMRELSVQSSNDTNVEFDRGALQDEINELKDEINRIGDTTEFNTQKLLKGKDSDSKIISSDIQFKGGVDEVTAVTSVSAALTDIVIDPSTLANGDILSFNIDGQNIDITINDNTQVSQTSNIAPTAAGTAGSITIAGSSNSATAVDITAIAANNFQAAIKSALDASIAANTDLAGKYEVTNNVDPTKFTISQTSNNESPVSTISVSGDVISGGTLTDGVTEVTGVTAVNASASLNFTSLEGTNSDETNKAIMDLVEKGITIADVEIEFFNSADGVYSGDKVGVDIKAALNEAINSEKADTLVTSIVSAFNSQSSQVDATDNTNGTITLTSKLANAEGNNMKISDGLSDYAFNAEFQIGANKDQTISIDIKDMRSEALKIDKVDITERETAKEAITTINSAINAVSSQRSTLGAVQNRLEHTIKNLDTSAENLQAAESRIRDVDMAKEMMEFTKNNILSQAAQSMLAQANQSPQGVLQLLR